MPQKIKYSDPSFDQLFRGIVSLKRESEQNVDKLVSGIIDDIRVRGDLALIDFTQKFDNFNLDLKNISLSQKEIDEGYASCKRPFLDALQLAFDRIWSFHEKQFPSGFKYVDDVGMTLEYRWTPIESVGLYVPGGKASYPSSLLMNAIPALVAGVERLVICSPMPEGRINPLILAAAKICSIGEIYCIGGAQAIAAMAYGTSTICPVCKIVGPGNVFVSSAKRQVYGQVGIDNIAGPSEILVVCDSKNNPEWIAIDLLAQAEHDPTAQSILITDDEGFAEKVVIWVKKILGTLDREEIAKQSWENFGAIIIVKDLMDAVPLINELAPEHLEIAVERSSELASRIKNAGSIFLGPHTPEAVGDYIAGPNHVLPTSRSARFSSGLGVLDFMKRTSLIECDKNSLKLIGQSIVELAEAEGLEAHALSITKRLDD